MVHNIKLPTSSIQLLKQLDEWKIIYKHFTHEPLISVNESKLLQEKLFGNNKENGHIKNLYLRDKKKNNILFVAHHVSIYLDSKLKSYKNIFAHPLENNQTLEIKFDQLEKFFRKLSVEPKWINLDS